jgi:pimeloyl-ACP methyl ester carboxylesterase
MEIAHTRGGTGDPLLLVHGIGSHAQVWDPVVPLLRDRFEVVAIDLPGFGASPVLGGREEPSPAALAGAVATWMTEQGWERAHVAGNSLGGWIALELAQRGRTLSACALSPAGFWTQRERAYARRTLRQWRASARLLAPRIDAIARSRALRTLGAWQAMARPWRQTPEAYAAAVRALAAAPGWDATLAAMDRRHFTGGAAVAPPATVAWADRDRLLPPRQAERARRALPRARHVTLRGCGHVPTWDDPAQVAEVVRLAAAAPG